MPPETLHPALSSAKAFCDLLALASGYKLTQNGGAHRYHPKFIITERLVLVNEWRRDDCGIYVIPAGVELTAPPEDDPASTHSSAWPAFSGRRGPGLLFRVWQRGRWEHHGPWMEEASQVLHDLETKVRELADRARAEAQPRRAAPADGVAPRCAGGGALPGTHRPGAPRRWRALALIFLHTFPSRAM